MNDVTSPQLEEFDALHNRYVAARHQLLNVTAQLHGWSANLYVEPTEAERATLTQQAATPQAEAEQLLVQLEQLSAIIEGAAAQR
jgi:hypothetical protein